MKNMNEVMVFPNPPAVFEFAANDFKNRALATVKTQPLFSVALSGGNTPKLFFDILTSENYKNSIPWEHIAFFFGDERYVPANDSKSNYHMAYEHLFSKVPIKPANIYRIPTEFNDPNAAAEYYERTLRAFFSTNAPDIPSLDLIYLGLGDDAHTASLMPFTEVVKSSMETALSTSTTSPLVAALFLPETNMYRITLMPNVINNSKTIIFLTTGPSKANAVRQVLEGPMAPLEYPAQLIQGVHKDTLWYLDAVAAEKLTGGNVKVIEKFEKNA